MMYRPTSAGRVGWWCEFTAHTSTADGEGGLRVRTNAADTPEQALVWMRMAVRVLLSAFGPEDTERAFRWLDHGQWEAVMRLSAGEPYAFVASSGDTRIEWSARPVLFLPMAHAADGPPWPCTAPARCTCVAPGGWLIPAHAARSSHHRRFPRPVRAGMYEHFPSIEKGEAMPTMQVEEPRPIGLALDVPELRLPLSTRRRLGDPDRRHARRAADGHVHWTT